jgi:dTMP kinase
MYKARNGKESYLIAIEGPDRLGKATQARRLESSLPRLGYKPISEEVPYKDGVTRDLIYEMLFDGRATQHPVVFQTIQAMNRRIFQAQYLPNLAAHFDAIVLDRWIGSTIVYGRAAGVSDEQTECMLSGVIKPDLVFVFDGEPFPAKEREALDEYEKDSEFQRRVRAGFQRYANETPEAHLVDAHRDPNVITDELIAQCRASLPARPKRV